ncbi:hypothetical protein [Marinobacter salarius]|uniref:hypothetical protein n=1 Tax=Marinobacter salarius TaxID=1420917 RepID=UPI003BAA1B1D
MSDASDYRWNFEEGVHGRVLRCTNDHPKGYPCEYEPLTTEEAEGMADLIAKQGAEITTLRQKLEQAEMRCAELGQDAKNAAGSIIRTVNSRRKTILIKQAEAIEDWLNGEPEMGGLDDYASRLRQQADELERGTS